MDRRGSSIIAVYSKDRVWRGRDHSSCALVQNGKEKMRGLEIVVGFTLAALALFFFVGRAEESSKFIKALSDGYTNVIGAFTKA